LSVDHLEIQTLAVTDLSPASIIGDLIRTIKDVEVLVVYGAPVTENVIAAGKKLRLIISARGGPVNIDTEAATKKGIPVSNAPGHNAEAVADHTFGLLLAEVRNITRGHMAIKEGRWASGERLDFKSTEINGKTISIVGLGKVGSLVAKRAKGFGLRILIYDPYVPENDIIAAGGEKTELDTLLKESDFITVHARLTEENIHMFGVKEFNAMKPSAYFINASRGPIVDEKALYDALKNNKISGAGLDVFEEEPIDMGSLLLTLKNITLTPHIAHLGTSYVRGATMVAEEMRRFLTGEPLKYIVDAAAYRFEREMYEKIFRGSRIK
jgi:D-3-phosphoglycerate dehydrogenase